MIDAGWRFRVSLLGYSHLGALGERGSREPQDLAYVLATSGSTGGQSLSLSTAIMPLSPISPPDVATAQGRTCALLFAILQPSLAVRPLWQAGISVCRHRRANIAAHGR